MTRSSVLRGRVFGPEEFARLVALKARYDRGAFRELTDDEKRLAFARWLVEHRALDEGVDVVSPQRVRFLAFLAQRWPRRKVAGPAMTCRLPAIRKIHAG